MASRGMGAIAPSKMPTANRKARRDNTDFDQYAEGGKVSRVNEAGNYTKPGMRKALFNSIKAGGKGGEPGQWSARKARMLVMKYKQRGGGYRD